MRLPLLVALLLEGAVVAAAFRSAAGLLLFAALQPDGEPARGTGDCLPRPELPAILPAPIRPPDENAGAATAATALPLGGAAATAAASASRASPITAVPSTPNRLLASSPPGAAVAAADFTLRAREGRGRAPGAYATAAAALELALERLTGDASAPGLAAPLPLPPLTAGLRGASLQLRVRGMGCGVGLVVLLPPLGVLVFVAGADVADNEGSLSLRVRPMLPISGDVFFAAEADRLSLELEPPPPIMCNSLSTSAVLLPCFFAAAAGGGGGVDDDDDAGALPPPPGAIPDRFQGRSTRV